MSYTLIEESGHISAFVGVNEIVGAKTLGGAWSLYLTNRVVDGAYRCHPTVCSLEGAKQWVELIASLYVQAHPVVQEFDGDVSGSCAFMGDEERFA